MSPHRAQRSAAAWLAVGAAGVVALIVSVWLVGANAASDQHSADQRARDQQASQLRAGCARGVARDFESLGTNTDLRDFAREAAKARRADGKPKVAAMYDATARKADARIGRIQLRIPPSEDEASVEQFCRALYPPPR